MQYYGISDVGKVRKENQDRFEVRECKSGDCLIAALCDGMGSSTAGGIASEISIGSFTEFIHARLTSRTRKNPDYKEVLTLACKDANDTAYDYSLFDISLNGMGTTIVGGIIKNTGEVSLINVGDSRAYLISHKTGTISQITTDHSLVEDLVKSGVLSREQAKSHKQKNVITRAVGTEATIEPDYFQFTLDVD